MNTTFRRRFPLPRKCKVAKPRNMPRREFKLEFDSLPVIHRLIKRPVSGELARRFLSAMVSDYGCIIERSNMGRENVLIVPPMPAKLGAKLTAYFNAR